MKRQRISMHPAWLMLIGCCFFQFGGLGTLGNCIGIFFPFISQDLGFSTSTISFHVTIRGICTFLLLPLSGRLLPRARTRPMLTAASAACALSVASMAFFNKPWQWYLASVVYGGSGAFVFLTLTPILLNNWFAEKAGLAIGIAMAASGLGGIVMSPLTTRLIEATNWRMGYLFIGAVALITMLPFTAFVLETQPQRLGWTPYRKGWRQNAEIASTCSLSEPANTSSEQKSERGLPFQDPVLWCCFFIAICAAYLTVYVYHLSQFAFSRGLPAMVGASMVSFAMAGNIGGKLILGGFSPRFSVKNITLLATAATASGFIILQSCTTVLLLFLGSFLFGFSMALVGLALPLLISDLFAPQKYAAVLSLVMMATSAVGGFGTGMVGMLYDASGTFKPALMLGICVCGILFGLVLLGYRLRHKPQINFIQ